MKIFVLLFFIIFHFHFQFCTVPSSAVRIIAPNIIRSIASINIDQQGQAQPGQQTQQIVTNIPSTYHVPRGPAAVANISAPRATIATPLVKAASQTITRPGLVYLGINSALTRHSLIFSIN